MLHLASSEFFIKVEELSALFTFLSLFLLPLNSVFSAFMNKENLLLLNASLHFSMSIS